MTARIRPDSPQVDVCLGAIAVVTGPEDRHVTDVVDFERRWAAASATPFSAMGCRTYRPIDDVECAIVDAVRQAIDRSGLERGDIDGVVVATSDDAVDVAKHAFARRVLEQTGMTEAIPTVLSMQQCCSSMSAVRYARWLCAGGAARHVVVVAFDAARDDNLRLREYAFFGDCVVACVVSRDWPGEYMIGGPEIRMSFDGVKGEDTFASRASLSRRVFDDALDAAGVAHADVVRVFPTNLYRPLVMANAAAIGLPTSAFHFESTLSTHAHCGNCDWLLNLDNYSRTVGLGDGDVYVGYATAPGFAAATVLVAGSGHEANK